MDDLYEYSLESLWTSLAINTINKYEIKTKYSHLDSSSVSVHGEYKINPKQEGENLEENRENVIEITYGYSRDKRPDLKQFMLDLMVSSDGDVPLLMRTGSGNESDKNIFPSIIKGLPKNKLFMLKNNNHSRSVGGRGRWLPPPSNFVVELILYIINQVFLCKCIWN